MGKMLLVIGDPGTGKSTAIGHNEQLGIQGLDPKSTFIIKPNNKTLPFPNSEVLYNEKNKNLLVTRDMSDVYSVIQNINAKAKHIKTVIVEDITHFFNHKERVDAGRKDFDKWTEMATEVYRMTVGLEDELRPDLDIIYIGHVEERRETNGNSITVLQTPGKMLERKIQLPSYFTYVLHSTVVYEDGKPTYKFLTNNDGSGREAKSPYGALALLEDNDYGKIFDKIDTYHGKTSAKTEE